MTVTIRPTTGEDIARMSESPLPYRIRAWTAEQDGKILGIGGLHPLPGGAFGVFLDLYDGAERFPILLHKTALKLIEDAKARGIRQLVAMADTSKPGAERWLSRLGFKEEQMDGEKVFLWQA